MALPGYVEFVALLFFPGAALVELFKLSISDGSSSSLLEEVALAFAISLPIDVLVLAVRVSGLSLGDYRLAGIDPTTPAAILVVSLAVLLATVAIRRGSSFLLSTAMPSSAELWVFASVLGQAILVSAHFAKYPIFPQFQSVDFEQHVRITNDLLTGAITLLPGGILYYGIHLLMGALIALTGDLPLIVTQYAVGILAALSPLLVYLAVASLYGSPRTGAVTSVLYVATGFVWFGSVFNAGLYPNFYGILSILLVLAIAPVLVRRSRSLGVWTVFLLAVLNGYLSHYSFLTILPALVALPIATLLLEGRKSSLRWVHFAVPVVFVLPAVIVLAARPGLGSLLIQFVQQQQQGAGSISGDTGLSQYLASIPVLRYLVVEITNDAASLVSLALASVGAYLTVRTRRPMLLIVAVWLLALLVVAPDSPGAWRFSYMALMPVLILASLAFERLLPTPLRGRDARSRRLVRSRRGRSGPGIANRRWLSLVVLIVLLLSLVVNSWSWSLLADAGGSTGVNSQAQEDVLRSMQWIDQNLPKKAVVLSVTDWRYAYLNLMTGRAGAYAPLAAPDDAITALGNATNRYVVLTRVATVASPADESQNPFNTYPLDSRFHLVYNDSADVVIYQITG